MIRILAPGDEQLLERFLHHHADSSMFLRSNALAAGLHDEGNPLQATYVPDALQAGTVTARRASLDDLQSLADWHKSYLIETLGKRDHPDLLAFCRQDVAEAQRRGTLFVLTQQDRLVATCAFSARCLDCVQIGAVWTPSPLRSRGFARTVVAGALSLARSEGVTRSVLFTGDNNLAAQKAYLSLGYSRIGEYGLVLFRDRQQAGTLNE